MLTAAVGAYDLHAVGRTVPTSAQAPGWDPRAGVPDGDEAVVGSDAVVEDDPFAAAELPFASGGVVEPQLIYVESVPGFGYFGWAVVSLAVEATEESGV